MPSQGRHSFSYDPLDRLIASTVAATAPTYTYNGDGVLQSTQGATTSFL